MPSISKNILRTLYGSIPYKNKVFKLMKTIGWRPAPKIYRHLHFIGVFTIQVEKTKYFKMMHYGNALENELFWAGIEGFREYVSLLIWIELSKTAQCVFDIGANTGVYSLVTKTVNPKATVYAFEPISRIHEKLELNSQLNEFEVTCVQKAVSNKDAREIIYDLPTEHAYSASLNRSFLSDDDLIAVPIDSIKLDSFVEENQISQLNLIKIDVESYEPEVIEGFQGFINIYTPVILVEVLTHESADKLNTLLLGANYQYFNIDDANRKIRRSRQIEKSDDFNYLLCPDNKVEELVNNPALSKFSINRTS